MKSNKILISWVLILGFLCGIGTGILAQAPTKEITAYINDALMLKVNGEKFQVYDDNGSEYKPILYNNRAYLPIRALGEAIGAEVDWDESAQAVDIITINSNSTVIAPANHGEIKNVIYMIGDGMGLHHTQLAQWYYVGAYDRLNMQKMPVTGIVSTYSANSGVTDSAAAGTALATGYKTNNYFVGVDEQGKKLKNIFEASKDAGKATGMVVTSTITDATPAAFSAHQPSRDRHMEIADDISRCGADVILGGGSQYFIPEHEGGKRSDYRNLLTEMEGLGYSVVGNTKEMQEVNCYKLIGLLKKDNLDTPYPDDTSGIEPTLEEMTTRAIDILSKRPNGFVLMVEGSKIDKTAHANDTDNVMNETKLFDDAVKAAMEFAKKDGSTLVIVTADHETGGLSMPDNAGTVKGTKSDAKWTTSNHSANHVILYAYGPGSSDFSGYYDNTDICKKLSKLLELKDFPSIVN